MADETKETSKTKKQPQKFGEDLRSIRNDLGLKQEGMAKLFQVTTNSLARWEREVAIINAGNERKIKYMIEIAKDKTAMAVITKMLNQDDGMAAVSGFINMLFGLLEVGGIGYAAIERLLRPGSTLLMGIKEYSDRIHHW
jgi:transcriptional regulator with XRE-family HTH domain